MTASCGMISTVTRESQYAKMYEEKPLTLLVMPPINNSTNVEAKDLLYTSISRPLVEAGYYVISPLLAMDVLKAESAYDSELFFDAPLTRYFLKGSHGCVTLCDAVGKDLFRLKPDAVHKTIQHPLYSHFGEKLGRLTAEKKLGLGHGMKNILFFGLIRTYKGLDILLEAFGGLDETYQLIIAGEPYGSFDKYQNIIDRLPNKERISTNLKYIKDSEVKDYFSAADLAVLPYRSATQSGISSVAYHFNTPMIVTDVGGLKETIGDRGTGIVAKENTPEEIRREIIRYFDSPDLQENCKQNIALEKQRLSWQTFVFELEEFIKKL